MRVVKSVPIEDFEFRGSIKDSDVTKLIRAFGEEPHINEDEAEALLRLNRRCPIQGPTWSGFLVDVIADYILNHSGPEGYITAEKSQWLVSKLSSGGWVANRAELDLLVSILGKARWFPLSLATFALEQVAGAVIHGFGPLRGSHASGIANGAVPGTIGGSEIALLRVILNAFGGDSALPLTRPEAEILMSVHRAVAGRPLPLAWVDLYAKAIANVLLAEHGYSVPPRSVALSVWTSDEVPAALDEQVAVCLGNLRRDYHRQSGEERALARLERQRIEIVTGESIGAEDMGWLGERLASSFLPAAIETAVLAHLDRECLIGDFVSPPLRSGWAA
ncbi:hypothetical protein [Hyphomicrobium sp.]|uniref:hypothetical protein n=1 Tax=Hyphomicrobium sp. TaxID=82 RepID=UPI002E37DFF3|nr:hypothetical protein [Hyphomicrobium sp.]HEX2842475.1 hypothetical protein [Hyphomicrobium sp.]